jgi:hypothetical protein
VGLTDGQVALLYRTWSLERYCVSFLAPAPDRVEQFRKWLGDGMPYLKSAEQGANEGGMVAEYRRQEMERLPWWKRVIVRYVDQLAKIRREDDFLNS